MKWNNDLIKSELISCIQTLDIERMPTADELKTIGRNDLHCKVSRTKKYSGWAKELGLPLTSCETRTGQKSEERILQIMQKSFEVERMSTKYPYDLFVNGCVKVDVKSAKPHNHNGTRAHTFAINKVIPTCDVYVIAVIDEQDEFERILIIPSHLVKMKSLNIGKESKWNLFLGRWDIIRQYSEFYKRVV